MTKAQSVSVRERPILFSASMIQALLAGRKIQTRRVMRPQPQPFAAKNVPGEFWHIPFKNWPDGRIRRDHMGAMLERFCPYGKVGDRLWVRETHYLTPQLGNPYYKADNYCNDHDRIDPDFKWRPSIHMPRWASRLTLEITGVRVEQVQSITVDDIYNEGLRPVRDGKMLLHHSPATDATYREDWQALWDNINGKKLGTSFADNPWCWVLNFRVEEAKQ